MGFVNEADNRFVSGLRKTKLGKAAWFEGSRRS